MRGYSPTPRVDVNTFIILDRLYGTLDDKIEQWEHLTAMAKGCCGLSEKSPQMVEVLKDRLLVAYDLSSAFNYLHDVQYVPLALRIFKGKPFSTLFFASP